MLRISSKFCWGYVVSLDIIKKEQPKVWKSFCMRVPIFSVALSHNCSNFILGICTHIYYRKTIKQSVVRYIEIWDKNGRDIIFYLESLFGCKLTKKRITAYVCITPLYIRNIQNDFFLLPTNAEKNRVLELFLHEISHFYFYQMLDDLACDTHKAWELSEYIVPYIIKDFFGYSCLKYGYLGEPCVSYSEEISKWISHKIDFITFIYRTIGGKEYE